MATSAIIRWTLSQRTSGSRYPSFKLLRKGSSGSAQKPEPRKRQGTGETWPHEVIPHVTCLSPHLLCRSSMTRNRERHPHKQCPPSARRSLRAMPKARRHHLHLEGRKGQGRRIPMLEEPTPHLRWERHPQTFVPGIRLRRRPARTSRTSSGTKCRTTHREPEQRLACLQRPLCL